MSEIQILQTAIEEVMTVATHRTINPGEHYQGRNHSDKVSAGAVRLAELASRLEEEQARERVLWMEIFRVIDAIEEVNLAAILARYYLELQTFSAIAEILGMSERWVLNLHKRGLDEVARILEEKTANK